MNAYTSNNSNVDGDAIKQPQGKKIFFKVFKIPGKTITMVNPKYFYEESETNHGGFLTTMSSMFV